MSDEVDFSDSVGAPERPRRLAAQQARQRIEAPESTSPLASDDDGEESGESEDAEEDAKEEDVVPPMSEYELKRLANIAANQEMLLKLGLVSPSAATSKPRVERAPRPRQQEPLPDTPIAEKRARRVLRPQGVTPPSFSRRDPLQTQKHATSRKLAPQAHLVDDDEVIVIGDEPDRHPDINARVTDEKDVQEDEVLQGRLAKLFQALRNGLLAGISSLHMLCSHPTAGSYSQ